MTTPPRLTARSFDAPLLAVELADALAVAPEAEEVATATAPADFVAVPEAVVVTGAETAEDTAREIALEVEAVLLYALASLQKVSSEE